MMNCPIPHRFSFSGLPCVAGWCFQRQSSEMDPGIGYLLQEYPEDQPVDRGRADRIEVLGEKEVRLSCRLSTALTDALGALEPEGNLE